MSKEPAKIWWSAAEIAEANLPDLPGTKRRIQDVVRRNGWQAAPKLARRRQERGGGWEYHWSLFPARARARLLAEAVTAKPAPKRDRGDAWAEYEQLRNSGRSQAEQRLSAIQHAELLVQGGSTRDGAVRTAAFYAGVSVRTVWNWFELIEGVAVEDRLAYLAPRHRRGGRATKATEIDPDFGAQLKSDYLRLSQPSFRSAYDRAVRWAEQNGIEVPAEHNARRWYKRSVSKSVEVLARKGVEALKRLYPAQIRDRSELHAMEGVNGDYHKFDVFVRMITPDGERVTRPQMVAFQDLFSGKILAWRFSYSANSATVLLCLGDLIEEWGIPEHVLLDNGREFAAKLITGGTATRFRFKVKEDDIPGLLTTLGCEVHWATPHSGQSKPIERAFKTLCDRVAKHPAFDGAYTGNRPEAKPEDYGSRAVPFDEFVTVVDAEIRAHNARPDRRSHVAYGRSYDAVFEESYAKAPIRKATAEQRRLWLMGAEGVTVGRTNGRISFMGNAYFDEFLHEHLGQKVVARFDADALWDGLHIYALSGEYLGFAECQEKVGFFDVNGAKDIKRARTEFTKATREALKAQRTLTAAEVATGAMTAMPPAPKDKVEASVVALPKPHKRAAKPAPRSPEDDMPLDPIVTSMDTHRARRVPAKVDDERDLFARAMEFEARQAEGKILTRDQESWLRDYQTLPEYRAQKQLQSEFGRGGLG